MIGSLAIGRRRLPAAVLGAPLPPSLAPRRALFAREAFEIGPALLRRHVAEAAAERAAAAPGRAGGCDAAAGCACAPLPWPPSLFSPRSRLRPPRLPRRSLLSWVWPAASREVITSWPSRSSPPVISVSEPLDSPTMTRTGDGLPSVPRT